MSFKQLHFSLKYSQNSISWHNNCNIFKIVRFSPPPLMLADWCERHSGYLAASSSHKSPLDASLIKGVEQEHIWDLNCTWLDVNFELEQYLGDDWWRFTSPQEHKYRQERILRNSPELSVSDKGDIQNVQGRGPPGQVRKPLAYETWTQCRFAEVAWTTAYILGNIWPLNNVIDQSESSTLRAINLQ